LTPPLLCPAALRRQRLAGTAQPKQYQRVAGQPLVRHTLAAFVAVARIARVLVVVAPGDGQMDDVRAPVERAPCGGGTRAESVFNGLGYLLATGARPGDWVLVHDAARCLVTPAQIEALIDACLPDAVGGLLALPLADTLKRAADGRAVGTGACRQMAGADAADVPPGRAARGAGGARRQRLPASPTRPAPSRPRASSRCWCAAARRTSR
jgi:2-C-methyl-D-erythritol 4-phosphate cytidylyltransferase